MTTLIPKYAKINTVNRPINLKLAEFVSVKDYGAVGDGTTDDTAAIVAAIAASSVVYFPYGTYKVTSSIAITTPVTLFSDGTGYTYFGDAGTGQTGATILCGSVTGYVFTFNLPGQVAKGLQIKGLSFDGTFNSLPSTTCNGLVVNLAVATASSPVTSLILDNCQASNFNTSLPLLDLTSFINVNITQCSFARFSNVCINVSGNPANIATTILVDRCHIYYGRQAISIFSCLNIHFRDCIFETLCVGCAIFQSAVLFSQCYFENIGATWAGFTTGTVNKDFGQSGSVDPLLITPITSNLNFKQADATFISCQFTNRDGANHADARFIYQCGIPSAVGGGSVVNLITCGYSDNANASFFEVLALAQQNLCTYSWVGGFFSPQRLLYSDYRLMNNSNVWMDFTGGAYPALPNPTEIKDGKFIINSATSTPTSYPVGGNWIIGDKVYYTTPTTGGFIGAVCTTASSDSTTGGITTGTNTLTLANAKTFADGNIIVVIGAGVAGANLTTTITSGGGTVNLVLAANASTTVVAAVVNSSGTWKTFGVIS
jgi:hypothetical protein